MHRFLFLLKSYPDIDHMVPMIWKVLEEGDEAFIVFEEPYDYPNDFRLQFVLRHPRCRVLEPMWSSDRRAIKRVISRALWNPFTMKRWLRRLAPEACFVEWGLGVRPNERGVRGFLAEVRRKRALSSRPKSWPRRAAETLTPELRLAMISAAIDLGIPVVALPHGVSTKSAIDYNPKLTAWMQQHGGVLPVDDRNCFAAWVFPWEHHRRLTVEHAQMNPQVAQTWGSLRFSPQWMTVLREICPPATLPAKGDRTRVVFFLPKWGNRVDQAATVDLIRSLAARDDVQLVLKTHPRKGVSELSDDVLKELEAGGRVVLADTEHSASLVRASDVVIDVGSGMAIDAVLEGKVTLYPAFLHQNKLVFDDIRACLMPGDIAGVHAILDQVRRGSPPVVNAEVVEQLNRELVFGGTPPKDVPGYYYSQILSIIRRPPARAGSGVAHT
jgi:hypothetical protein